MHHSSYTSEKTEKPITFLYIRIDHAILMDVEKREKLLDKPQIKNGITMYYFRFSIVDFSSVKKLWIWWMGRNLFSSNQSKNVKRKKYFPRKLYTQNTNKMFTINYRQVKRINSGKWTRISIENPKIAVTATATAAFCIFNLIFISLSFKYIRHLLFSFHDFEMLVEWLVSACQNANPKIYPQKNFHINTSHLHLKCAWIAIKPNNITI